MNYKIFISSESLYPQEWKNATARKEIYVVTIIVYQDLQIILFLILQNDKYKFPLNK